MPGEHADDETISGTGNAGGRTVAITPTKGGDPEMSPPPQELAKPRRKIIIDRETRIGWRV